MSDLDKEAIELGILSIGDFDIDNCSCDATVGMTPCHYCAELGAILAGKRVLDRLFAAEAEIEALRAVAARDLVNWFNGRMALAQKLDKCRKLLREACDYIDTAGLNDAMISRWAERAAKLIEQ